MAAVQTGHRRTRVNADKSHPNGATISRANGASRRYGFSGFRRGDFDLFLRLLATPDFGSEAGAKAAGRGSRGPWNKWAGVIGPFMPRKPLDALEAAHAIGSCRGWFFDPRQLPHGECGVWGSAPRFFPARPQMRTGGCAQGTPQGRACRRYSTTAAVFGGFLTVAERGGVDVPGIGRGLRRVSPSRTMR